MVQTKSPKRVLKRLTEMEMMCVDLENQLSVLQTERDNYKEKYEDILVENIRLQEKLTDIRERLRKHEPLVEKEEAGEVMEEEEVQMEEERDCFAELPLKVAIIGGTEAWQAKVVARHPYFKMIGSNKNFDRDKLAGTDILVINTNAVSHACTQKAKGEVSKGAEVIIISTNNLDILDQKIHALLL